MKYLVIFFALFITTSAFAQEDAISKYFSKYVDDDRFTVVYVRGKMFQMINKMELNFDDDEAEAVLSVVKDLKGLRILTTEENGLAFYKEALSIINTKDYETLMTVREGNNENVQFLIRDENGQIHELLMVRSEKREFMVMSVYGDIDLNAIGRLSKVMKVRGMEGFGDLDGDH